MTIDPRLIERRKAVAEDRAKRSVGRVLKLIGFGVVAGFVVWLALSPWFSVSQVRTAGIVKSDTNRLLGEQSVVAGTPMILIRTDSVEERLEQDPWVRGARVMLDWPDEVIVRVDERVPIAWFATQDGWSRRDVEGVAVPSAQSPDETLPRVHLRRVADIDAASDQFVVGAAEFIESLPTALVSGLEMRVEDGEMWALAAGFDVRLGRPIEMKAKALSLDALLRESIPDGSTLVLVAPAHPAVSPPTTEAAPEEADQAGDRSPAASATTEPEDG